MNEIARRLHRSDRQIRYQTSLPTFQDEYRRFSADFFGSLDTKISRLLHGSVYKAVLTLLRQLKHPDWRARDSAEEKLLKINGRLIERVTLDLRGSVEVNGSIDHQHSFIPPDQMSDEMRDCMRRMLALTREHAKSRMLARITSPNGEINGNGHEDV